ncbi:hypothetical protein BBJ28_00007891 [Nothophytophthora sp. Chile5]|nr:hypothetical protein BBJ28_00007891 [Nothophytophthora sp. Chile5]
MEIVAVPVLHDNYAYLLIDSKHRTLVSFLIHSALDPVDAGAVYARASELNVKLTAILTTHIHWDHAGGNLALKRLVLQKEGRQLKVVGGQGDDVPGATRHAHHGETIALGDLTVRVLATPCHTRGHVMYCCQDALFTGDTLFVAGCGRFFSGSAAEMHHALNEVVASLPKDTKVFCGHEYTVSNLRFAAHVEPDNAAIQEKLAWATIQTAKGESTIPSTIAEELATNPFMRIHHSSVQTFVGGETDPAVVMGKLRAAKDGFNGGGGKTQLFAMAWHAAVCFTRQMEPRYQIIAALGVGFVALNTVVSFLPS